MFEQIARSGNARCGMLKTKTCKIKTPFFMPVTTKGAAKFIDFEELKKIGTDCVISNSWLLYQRPGLKLIKKAKGLHNLYSWNRGIFTDSGGFQSLNEFFLKKSDEDGAYFKSPYDGKTELITPEIAMDIQLGLGPDVAMCLDDVPQHDDDTKTIKEKTKRTHAWAKRCIEHHKKHNKSGQLLFGIAQGGMDKGERKKSIEYLCSLGFDGLALGGLAIGEPVHTMYEMIDASIGFFPEDKVRYLMGVGTPEDIVSCVSMGVDCFDSTYPTQTARHGTLFTWKGKLKLNRAEYADDLRPIDSGCDCYVCKNYSRAYLRHLINLSEPTGKKLATYHNLYFMQRLMEKIRQKIIDGTFEEFKDDFLKHYTGC